MIDEELDLDTYEQLYIMNIESQNRMVMCDIENFAMNKRSNVDIIESFHSIIKTLQLYEKYFLFYEPTAQRLTKNGRTQLSKRLYEILSDIHETIHIFEYGCQRAINKENLDTDIDLINDVQ